MVPPITTTTTTTTTTTLIPASSDGEPAPQPTMASPTETVHEARMPTDRAARRSSPFRLAGPGAAGVAIAAVYIGSPLVLILREYHVGIAMALATTTLLLIMGGWFVIKKARMTMGIRRRPLLPARGTGTGRLRPDHDRRRRLGAAGRPLAADSTD